MITNISEGPLRVASKIDPGSVIHEREFNQQRADAMRESRPVEESNTGGQAEAKKDREDEGSSKYLLDDKHVVFEKYDKNGDLILRIPPSQTPVDQVV